MMEQEEIEAIRKFKRALEASEAEVEHHRWLVEIDYITDTGINTVDHHIEELLVLAGLVEKGPDWHAIEQIRITLNPARRLYDCTVEQDQEGKSNA
jgi:hypothetical protein